MMAHGEALGLLYLDTGSSEDLNVAEISSESFGFEERLARTFAEQSALALANLNMRDILKMQSVKDPRSLACSIADIWRSHSIAN
jgi:hypothetical protein